MATSVLLPRGGFSPSSSSSSMILLLLLVLVAISSASPVHELVSKFGFPPGIFPKEAKNYKLSTDGFVDIELDQHCLLNFVWSANFYIYEKRIRLKLNFGRITDITGITTQKRYYYTPGWVPVTAIDVGRHKGYVVFEAPSSNSRAYSIASLKEIRHCMGRKLDGHSCGDSCETSSIPISEV
ncbi:hypothetical protein J5N97_011026 [Dioscorea zingiberensis]|uniref:Uncharacterized protein n=1 Tax=Dioscorea zingiberensis TaxID=325984 RepID=A0A9D5HNC0_9LILI|nr:hypothetical protein J5N97_011026 [Dioscorea zingiberensis]